MVMQMVMGIKHDSKAVSVEEIRALLKTVNDPEVPVLSILDLGIVRDIKADDDRVEVVITPTYSGCPAMDMIRMRMRWGIRRRRMIRRGIIPFIQEQFTI